MPARARNKVLAREHSRAYRRRNRRRYNQRARERRAAMRPAGPGPVTPQRIRDAATAWRKANPERARQHCRNYYAENREEILERQRLRRKARALGLPPDAFLRELKRTGPRALLSLRRQARRRYRRNVLPERARRRRFYHSNRTVELIRRKARRCGVSVHALQAAA